MIYAGYNFKAPISAEGLDYKQEKFRNTLLICEHGTRVLKTEQGSFRVLKDSNHNEGALGNMVLSATYSPDYTKHGKGFKTINFSDASPKEKSAAEGLMEKYGLKKPLKIVRLGLNKTSGTKYYSYFTFADDEQFNKYFKARFPNSSLSINDSRNKAAIISYGGYDSYYDFFVSVYNSWDDEES